MTFNDLCADVAALGFETSMQSSETIIRAANRALRSIYSEQCIYSEFKTYQDKTNPCEHIEAIRHNGQTPDVIPFCAKSFCFRHKGLGSYRIRDEKGVREFEFKNDSNAEKGFLYGIGEIEFIGNYSYTVYDLCFYDEISSDNEADIPLYSPLLEYDMTVLTDDFSSFYSMPKDRHDRDISGAQTVGKIMQIPSFYKGEVKVLYKRAPKLLSGDIDEEVELPRQYEHLFALLTAAYVWLDDDPAKAQYYMTLYREGMLSTRLYARNPSKSEYHDVTGWA